ncbi:MAG: hypothetical protein WGN25_11850 [Candidatus Electrothrix sp. GW3-4]|uniref:hypothetical protein n=1 Tax=Candidatus Electrothrix sp. GW3-4 TaxID=3126740 RepID=UPI0030D422C1
MVVKKNQLGRNKGQGSINAFEKFFFMVLASLSFLFLLFICWILLTGDDVIFLHGSNIPPRHFVVFLSVQSFFGGSLQALRTRITGRRINSFAPSRQLTWQFSPI